jgi:Ni2+-binding GTPase involved in maturation of urease and hydrogenase
LSNPGGALLDLFPSRDAGPFGRRRKRVRGARIPVTIVTGFLGAGKTTLLRRFLATAEGEGTAVVINEFGSIGIDDALVRASTDEVTLLGNGCLCCNARSDLQIALRGLVAEREQGRVPQFRRILIETSGLAEPGPILQTFATDRALGGEFHVEVLLAMVDAVTGLDTLHWSAEARKQIILADRLVISKCDLAAAQSLDRVSERLHLLIHTPSFTPPLPAASTRAASPRQMSARRHCAPALLLNPSTATAFRASSSLAGHRLHGMPLIAAWRRSSRYVAPISCG